MVKNGVNDRNSVRVIVSIGGERVLIIDKFHSGLDESDISSLLSCHSRFIEESALLGWEYCDDQTETDIDYVIES